MTTHFFNFFNFFFFFFIALFLVLLVQSSGFPLNFSPDTGNFDDPWQHFMNFSGCHAGDHAPGLSKLKQYFQLFGYIPESSSLTNFTDDFDEAFETAIKTYQLNFNLPTTGTLDDSTLKRIVQPRCGVADIINGSTTMNSGGQHKPMHSPAIHSVGHYSFFPGQPRWPPFKRDLTYSFSPRNQLTDPVKSVFKRAFDRWAAVTPLTFTETSVFSMADMRIGFFSGEHGDGEPFDGVLGTLAHAFSPPDGRFHLDAAENWVVDASLATASATAVDMESVAVHEIGHLLGLGHSSVEEAIMFPTISSRAKKVELARDDIEGIQVLYGGNPSYQSSDRSSPPASQERERSDSGGGRLLVGVGWWTTLVLSPLVMLVVHFL